MSTVAMTHTARMLLLAGAMLVACLCAAAQSGKLPPFRVIRSNGKVFRAEDLPMGKPIVIIYFSPECDHCDQLMQALLKRTAEFSGASIAMVTHLPVESVAKFTAKYRLNRFANIYVGTEGSTFFLKNYYKIMEMPFAALYTKNGDLVQVYEKHVDIKALSDRLIQLK